LSNEQATGMHRPTRDDKAATARLAFSDRYGSDPTHIAWAPGRLNLIGEHTDYNDGFVLPMATETGVLLAARPRPDRTVRVWSRRMGESFELSLDEPIAKAPPPWSLYVRGVLAGLTAHGLTLPGFDAAVTGDLPAGGGLSSSAALEVATATLGEALVGTAIDPIEKALLCQEAEHTYAGVPCGIMDQFAVVLARSGHLLLLDCRSRRWELVPLANEKVEVLIINSMVRHELSGGEYALRRQQCQESARLLGVASLRDVTADQVRAAESRLPDVNFRRALHVATENERTLLATEMLQRGDWEGLGRLMYASHESLRRDYEVSCAELDVIVTIAREIGERNGVLGCRMTGGGFGGCAIALVRCADLARLGEAFRVEYLRRTGRVPKIVATQPADGATILQQP
jgi:galactokinase